MILGHLTILTRIKYSHLNVLLKLKEIIKKIRHLLKALGPFGLSDLKEI